MESKTRHAALAISLSAGVLCSSTGLAETPSIPEAPPTTPPVPTAAPTAAPTAPTPPPPVANSPAPEPKAAEPLAKAPDVAGELALPPPPAKKKPARIDPGPTGEAGLVRVVAAESGTQGTIRLSFGLEAFGASGFLTTNDDQSRVAGTLSLSVAALDWLELWAGTRASSTQSTLTDPELLQSQGDIHFGLKASRALTSVLSLGADLELGLVTGIGDSTFILDSSKLMFRALSTFDFRAHAPIRVHLNAGVGLDGTENLLTDTLTEAERFALGISDFHKFTTGLAIEVPLPYVTPFLEYSLEVPLGYLATPGIILDGVDRSSLRLAQTVPSEAPVARGSLPRVMPQRLTPGVRLTAVEGLAVTAAVEIGLTPDHATGVLPVPPFNVALSASYSFDPFHAPKSSEPAPPVVIPVLVPQPVEAPKTQGELAGTVTTPDGKPVAGAVIMLSRGMPAASGPDGRFRTHILDLGAVDASIEHPGFKPLGFRAEVSAGEAKELALVLIPEIKKGSVTGRLLGENGKPLANATITAEGATPVTTAADGKFTLELEVGTREIEIARADLFRTRAKIEIKEKEATNYDRILRSRPTKPLATATTDKIELTKPINFVGRESKLAPDADFVLDGLADLIFSKPELTKIRIEGHMDDEGNADENLKLSKERAELIVKALIDRGVAAERLTADGFGSERPIAPNLTKRGREKNRRIEIRLGE